MKNMLFIRYMAWLITTPIVTILFLIVIILNFRISQSAFAQTWSTTIPVTDESISCHLVDLEADNSGKIWILYHKTLHYPYDSVFVKYYDGSSLSPPIKTPVDSYSWGDLAIDSLNRVWLAWATYHDSLGSIRASYYADGSWSLPDTIVIDRNGLNNPMMTVDLMGNMWCAWSRVFGVWHDSCAICVSKWISSEWSGPMIVDQFIIPDVTIDPSIVCDGEGRIWVAWSNFVPVASYYDGSQWSEPVIIHDPEECFSQFITIDSQGRVWLMWPDLYGTDPNRAYGYYLSHAIGTEWSIPMFIPGSRELLHDISFAADPVGRIWVVYSKNDSIFCKYFHDGTWSSAMPVTNDPSFKDIRPLTISNNTNNLWVAWQRRNNNVYNIYMSYADITSVGVKSHPNSSSIPKRFLMIQSYPNPFNTKTVITYKVPEKQYISLQVYDIMGRRVITLVDADQQQGRYSIYWNGTDETGSPLASGIYFCHMETKSFVQCIKIVLLR